MKIFIAHVCSVLALTLGVSHLAEARILRTKSSYREAKRASIAALQPMGKDTFVVIAQGGMIEVGIREKKIVRRVLPNGKHARFVRDRARKQGQPVLVLDEPVRHVAHRLDTIRLINGPTWTALSLLTSLHLDQELIRGTYRYVLLSDPKGFVMIRNGSRKGVSGRQYTGVKVTLGRKTGNLRHNAEIVKNFGFKKAEGYVFDVAELPRSPDRGLSSRALMLRLQNRTVGESPIIERLISIQNGT